MRKSTIPLLLLAGLALCGAAHAAEPQQTSGSTDVAMSGMTVARDPATGELRAATPAESRELSQKMADSARADARKLNMPLDAREARLTRRTRADGAVSVRAPLSSMTELRATVGPDGSVQTYEAQPGSPAQPATTQEATQ